MKNTNTSTICKEMCFITKFYHKDMKRWEVHDPVSTITRGGTKKPTAWVKPWKVMPKFLRHEMVQVWIQHVDWFQFRHDRCHHVCAVYLIWAHPLFNIHLLCSGSSGNFEPISACIRRQAECILIYQSITGWTHIDRPTVAQCCAPLGFSVCGLISLHVSAWVSSSVLRFPPTCKFGQLDTLNFLYVWMWVWSKHLRWNFKG